MGQGGRVVRARGDRLEPEVRTEEATGANTREAKRI